MSALPVGELVHSQPRRVRIRLAEHRGDAEFFERLCEGMSAVPLVGEVHASALTATVVMEGIRIEPHELANVARQRKWFELREPSQSGDAADWLDRFARSAGQQRPVAGVLLALALLQIGRGSVLPPAITLAWYALEALRGAPRR